MIVREVLTDPGLIDTFDLFNDAMDTIVWLRGITDERREAAVKIADDLNNKHAAFSREHYRRTMGLE